MTIDATVKVGDLVKLGTNATNKGLSWQNQVGIVLDVNLSAEHSKPFATVNFAGTVVEYPLDRLRVLDESR